MNTHEILHTRRSLIVLKVLFNCLFTNKIQFFDIIEIDISRGWGEWRGVNYMDAENIIILRHGHTVNTHIIFYRIVPQSARVSGDYSYY